MNIDKSQLIDFIMKSDKITIHICNSYPGDKKEDIVSAPLNDLVLNNKTKELELWYNTGYEI